MKVGDLIYITSKYAYENKPKIRRIGVYPVKQNFLNSEFPAFVPGVYCHTGTYWNTDEFFLCGPSISWLWEKYADQ